MFSHVVFLQWIYAAINMHISTEKGPRPKVYFLLLFHFVISLVQLSMMLLYNLISSQISLVYDVISER